MVMVFLVKIFVQEDEMRKQWWGILFFAALAFITLAAAYTGMLLDLSRNRY